MNLPQIHEILVNEKTCVYCVTFNSLSRQRVSHILKFKMVVKWMEQILIDSYRFLQWVSVTTLLLVLLRPMYMFCSGLVIDSADCINLGDVVKILKTGLATTMPRPICDKNHRFAMYQMTVTMYYTRSYAEPLWFIIHMFLWQKGWRKNIVVGEILSIGSKWCSYDHKIIMLFTVWQTTK